MLRSSRLLRKFLFTFWGPGLIFAGGVFIFNTAPCASFVLLATSSPIWRTRSSSFFMTENKESDTESSSLSSDPRSEKEKADNNSNSRSDQKKTFDNDPMSTDDWLDKPFFVPEKVDEKSPLKPFANLVEKNYQTAEALFASLFITLMVVGTQEVLRMQLYGDAYVPFVRGSSGGGGNLF